VTATPTRAGNQTGGATASATETDPNFANNIAMPTIAVSPFPAFYLFGAGAGGAPVVRVIDAASGTEVRTILAFPVGFTGGVSVAQGDVTGDGVPEVIVGAGPGGSPTVVVFDVLTGALVRAFFAYAPDFRGGVQVAAADITGDGVADVLAGAGVGGAPHVAIFDGPTAKVIRSVFAFDPAFRDGVSVAAGDENGDGIPDVIAGARQGGAPQVATFDGPTGNLIKSFFTGDPSFRGGIDVAAADLNGDGVAEIIAGAGIGGGPVVAVFDPKTGDPLASIFAYDQAIRGGVHVGAVNVNGVPAVLTGPGPGLPPTVKVFTGPTLTQATTFDAFPGAENFLGGVFVG
jgi:hypothetical protein